MRCACSACAIRPADTVFPHLFPLMEILYLLIPLSVVLVFVIAVFFWWSERCGQYDDLEGPAYRLLMDDDDRPPATPGKDEVDRAKDVSKPDRRP